MISHRFTYAALALSASFISLSAHAISVRGVGSLGYDNVTYTTDDDLGGFGFAAGVEVDALALTSGTDLIGGAQLRYFNVDGEINDFDFEHSQFIFSPYVGVNVRVSPRFLLASTIGYEFGISGEVSEDLPGGERDWDTESFRRFSHEWRGVFAATGQLGVGLGVNWNAGSFEFDDPISRESNFRGWGMRGLVTYNF